MARSDVDTHDTDKASAGEGDDALLRPNFAQVVFDATHHGMWTIGLDGCITSVNQAALDMFGYTRSQDMVGRNSHALVHHTRADGTPYPQTSCPIYHAFQRGEAVHLDNEVLWRADGASFNADYHSVPTFVAGQISGAVVTFVDNSEAHRVRQKLQTSQVWLEATLNSMGDAVVTTDVGPSPKITFMNPVAEALTGWTQAEAIGLPLCDVCRIVDSVGQSQPLEAICKVVEVDAEHGAAVQTILQSRDGEHYFVEQRVTRIRDKDGRIQGLVSVYHDITTNLLAKRRLQEKEVHLSLALEGAQMGTWAVDLETTKLTCSPQMHRIVGESASGLVLRDYLKKFVHQTDWEGIRTRWNQAVASGSPYVDEYRIIRADGAIRWISLKGRPAVRSEDNRRCISGVISDITESVDLRHQAELATQKLAKERENLAGLVDNLNAERELRERFVLALTHDLRAPMTAAKMSAQLLKRKIKGEPAITKLSDRIVDSVNRAERMVQDLLDANRLKAGHGIPISPDACQINDVIDTVTQELVHQHGDRFFVRKAHDDILGFWDKNGLHRILENLASNAVKYGDIDTTVTIAVDRLDDKAHLSVHNEGPPMAAHDRAVLFDPFRRLESAVQSGQRGWGIGLSLVKGLTEAHGGTISVESEAGAGTTFTVRLPITQQVQP